MVCGLFFSVRIVTKFGCGSLQTRLIFLLKKAFSFHIKLFYFVIAFIIRSLFRM